MRILLLLLAAYQIRGQENFSYPFAEFALEFSAAAYSPTPIGCLKKNNASLIYRITEPCDYLRNECWVIIATTEDWIIVAFRGTRTKLQLIMELVESMSEPKKEIRAGGSVQHYFYVALNTIWRPVQQMVQKLKRTFPQKNILFTGHSLGGALASIASTVFAHRFPKHAESVYLVTFGQPRVGNFEYADAHDRLVPNSWRIVHKYDLVAHLPACYRGIHSCTTGYNHGPYHHGTEIWFPGDMGSNDEFAICSGEPVDEDDSCSNAYYFHYDIKDHLHYFNHDVSAYGLSNCIDPTQSLLLLSLANKSYKP